MKFWDEIIEFNNKHFPDWRTRQPMYYTNAIAGEVGELCNLTKRLAGGGTNYKEFSKGQLVEECADILIYMTLLLDSMMITEDAFQSWFDSKLKILYQRMEGRSSLQKEQSQLSENLVGSQSVSATSSKERGEVKNS